MPRNISFALTTPQFINQSKTVTRRFGWAFLKQGDILCGVEKAMGLKKGEKIKKLGLIQVISTKWERLEEISDEDCIREGFPEMKAEDFIQFLINSSNKKIDRKTIVNRIEFVYLDPISDLNDWVILKNLKPIPSSAHDWDFHHIDYDGSPDSGDIRCGTAESEIAAISAIKELCLLEKDEFITPACKKCDDNHYFLVRCCSGAANQCGCMGQPVALERCEDCNPDAKLEPGDSLGEYAKNLGVING